MQWSTPTCMSHYTLYKSTCIPVSSLGPGRRDRMQHMPLIPPPFQTWFTHPYPCCFPPPDLLHSIPALCPLSVEFTTWCTPSLQLAQGLARALTHKLATVLRLQSALQHFCNNKHQCSMCWISLYAVQNCAVNLTTVWLFTCLFHVHRQFLGLYCLFKLSLQMLL